MKGFRKLMVGGLAVLFTMGLVMAEEKTYNHEFKVEPGAGQLSYHGIDGDVDIRTHDADVILFTFQKKLAEGVDEDFAQWFRGIKPEVKQDGNSVTIRIKYPKKKKKNVGMSWLKAELKTTLVLPKVCAVKLNVVDGDVTATDVSGTLGFHLVDGDLELSGCSGAYDVHTVDGDISIVDGKGNLETHTVDGDIKATGEFDMVHVKSTDGDARIVVTGISGMAGDWAMGSVDGDLTLIIPDDLSFRLEAGSMDGDIEMEGFSNMKIIKKKKRKLIAEQGDAAFTISMSVVDGDLTIQGK